MKKQIPDFIKELVQASAFNELAENSQFLLYTKQLYELVQSGADERGLLETRMDMWGLVVRSMPGLGVPEHEEGMQTLIESCREHGNKGQGDQAPNSAVSNVVPFAPSPKKQR